MHLCAIATRHCASRSVARAFTSCLSAKPEAVKNRYIVARPGLVHANNRIGCPRFVSAAATDGSVASVVQQKISSWDVELETGLYLVGTPIGNLEDITLRALRILGSASAILAEDTRTTRKLVDHFQLKTPLISYHTHNERSREAEVLTRLKRGEALAIVSDAGMPGISDPGSALVAAVAAEGISVIPVPGPSAVLAGLVGSGLPTDEFMFVGFLPPKKAARQQRIRELVGCKATLIMYVSPHALLATLEDMAEIMGGDRRCCVSRELTKIYEEFWRSSLSDAAEEFTARNPRGEVTLVVEGGDGISTAMPVATAEDRVKEMLLEGMSVSDVSKKVAREFPSFGRRKAYNLSLELQKQRAAAKGSTEGE